MEQASEVLLKTRKFSVQRLFLDDGSAREIVRHPGAVAVLPRLEGGRICLIRNFRAAAGKELIELPAGTIDAGEEPGETARRELAEETGYRAGSLRKLAEFFMSPGILDERMHLFVAENLAAGAAAREPGEQIENLVVSFEEALSMIRDGRIADAKTIAGLLYWNFLREDENRI